MNNYKYSIVLFSVITLSFIIIGIMNFMLFHLSLELITIFIGIMIFLVAQNTTIERKTGIILSIGIAYLYIGILDYMHLMTHEGFGIIDSSINMSSQYWLSARMLEAFNILFAFIIYNSVKKTNRYVLHIINSVVVLSTLAIVYYNLMPDFYIEGQGLTFISLITSIVIILILTISIWFIYRSELVKRNKNILILVILLKIMSEAIFSQYNYDGNAMAFAGHLLKFGSYVGLYYIFISGMIRDPFIQAHKFFKKKETELIELSQRDSLTGLYNHSYTFSKIEDLIERIGDDFKTLAVIMIDIDDFKQVNDNYGHIKGDEALVEFSKLLLEHDRHQKIVGRYGGDEFVVACPNVNKDNVIMRFSALNKKMREMSKRIGANITFSAGIAFYTEGDLAKDLIYKADIKMYESKRKGKNQFTIWNEE